ncbi:MAG: nitroreductase family protein [Gemmatimonadetes bacterium]|nr:nitroreductase family protein [Gemmatimonadota bacterium]
MTVFPQVPFHPIRHSPEETLRRGREFYDHMNRRRSVRFFSPDPVPREAIELAIQIAGTAPSGAHQQPWTFVVVDDPELKRQIRLGAEEEEREFYEHRAPAEWLEALAPLGTDWRKPFLEIASYLIVVFRHAYRVAPDGAHHKTYYSTESVGIAVGLLIAALHTMGLCTLTHTPSPMEFLNGILGRPEWERPFVLLPVGYAAPDATVPDLKRKALDEVAVWNKGGSGR